MGESTEGLEGRLEKLESIVERLERDELELEEALGLFEEGVVHIREAYRVLEESQLRVEKLAVDMDGSPGLEREPPRG